MDAPPDCYREFNKALKFFMRELMKIHPDVGELKLMFSLYKVMKTVNRKSPQRYFQELIEPHADDLIKKNVNYFLSSDFDDPASSKIISRFKKEYVLMSDENKETVWKHMVVLYHLSLKCSKIDASSPAKYSQQKVQDGLQA